MKNSMETVEKRTGVRFVSQWLLVPLLCALLPTMVWAEPAGFVRRLSPQQLESVRKASDTLMRVRTAQNIRAQLKMKGVRDGIKALQADLRSLRQVLKEIDSKQRAKEVKTVKSLVRKRIKELKNERKRLKNNRIKTRGIQMDRLRNKLAELETEVETVLTLPKKKRLAVLNKLIKKLTIRSGANRKAQGPRVDVGGGS